MTGRTGSHWSLWQRPLHTQVYPTTWFPNFSFATTSASKSSHQSTIPTIRGPKEFLPDNVALHQRLESLGSVAFLATPSPARPNLHEVPNLLSLVSCFATCAAVLAEARPDLIKSHLAYLALIVAEARKHGGDGWQAYDSVFGQNAAHDPTADWSRLDTSLHAATFFGSTIRLRIFLPVVRSNRSHPQRLCITPILSPKHIPPRPTTNPGSNFKRATTQPRERFQWTVSIISL